MRSSIGYGGPPRADSQADSGPETKGGERGPTSPNRAVRKPSGPKASLEPATKPPAPKPPVSTEVEANSNGSAPAWGERTRPQKALRDRSDPKPAGMRIDLREHIEERRKARWKLLAYRLGAGLAIVSVIVFLVWLIFFSPVLALKERELVVMGLEDEERQVLVDPHVSSYLGSPLLRIPLGSLEEQILSSPSVAAVEIKRTWPDGLEVAVVRRDPVAVVESSMGTAVIGTDGVAIEPAGTQSEGLPLIKTSATEQAAVVADGAAGVEVWQSLTEDVAQQVEFLEVNRRRTTLQLTDGIEVVWGSSEASALKSEVLALLIEAQPAEAYDVSDPIRPVVG